MLIVVSMIKNHGAHLQRDAQPFQTVAETMVMNGVNMETKFQMMMSASEKENHAAPTQKTKPVRLTVNWFANLNAAQSQTSGVHTFQAVLMKMNVAEPTQRNTLAKVLNMVKLKTVLISMMVTIQNAVMKITISTGVKSGKNVPRLKTVVKKDTSGVRTTTNVFQTPQKITALVTRKHGVKKENSLNTQDVLNTSVNVVMLHGNGTMAHTQIVSPLLVTHLLNIAQKTEIHSAAKDAAMVKFSAMKNVLIQISSVAHKKNVLIQMEKNTALKNVAHHQKSSLTVTATIHVSIHQETTYHPGKDAVMENANNAAIQMNQSATTQKTADQPKIAVKPTQKSTTQDGVSSHTIMLSANHTNIVVKIKDLIQFPSPTHGTLTVAQQVTAI